MGATRQVSSKPQGPAAERLCQSCGIRKAKKGRRQCKHCYEAQAAERRADKRNEPRRDGNFIFLW